MTATDELRRMLNERGVKWEAPYMLPWEETTWHVGGFDYVAMDAPDGEALNILCNGLGVTPAQAIEATLGRGTCHAIVSDNLTESEGTGDAWADCSECGHLLCVLTDPSSQMPNYFPNCGRSVVADASVD